MKLKRIRILTVISAIFTIIFGLIDLLEPLTFNWNWMRFSMSLMIIFSAIEQLWIKENQNKILISLLFLAGTMNFIAFAQSIFV